MQHERERRCGPFRTGTLSRTVMSLAEASEARKARLIALRKRKEGGDDDGYVKISMWIYWSEHGDSPLIVNRNFDPESRTLRKHKADDVAMEDTVEHLAQSMAAQIMIDDEKRRGQELVCQPFPVDSFGSCEKKKRMCLI